MAVPGHHTGRYHLELSALLDESFAILGQALDGYTGEHVKSMMPDADPLNNITVEKYTFSTERKTGSYAIKSEVNGKHNL